MKNNIEHKTISFLQTFALHVVQAAFVAFLFVGTLHSQSKDPILRIETGTHNGIIRRISVDLQNRYLVTGAEDKTVRLWELSTGTLLKTYRPPIGSSDEGNIDAVAISADGTTIACSGWTGWDWDQQISIYLFNRETGTMVRRLDGIPDIVYDLQYTADGKYLGVLYNKGVRIYSLPDYRLLGQDIDYSGSTHCFKFFSSTHLMTAADDGYIRLYDLGALTQPSDSALNLVPVMKKSGVNGHDPFSVAFSPDGSMIGVGYKDLKKIDVFSGVTSATPFDFLFSPDMIDPDSTNLGYSLAWSSDGSYLFAGGTFWDRVAQARPVRRWNNGGRGTSSDLSIGTSPIGQIVALKNGGFAVAEIAAAFGVVDSSFTKAWYRDPYIADYRNNNSGFLTSFDGSTVQFGYELWGRSLQRFLISARSLDNPIDPEVDKSLQPPVTHSAILNITGWENTSSPAVNGVPITLDNYEDSKALAISPDKETFALGTGYYLRFYDYTGKEKWKVSSHGPCWAVNFSGNGKTIVSAQADGTIRWYRTFDGVELLAFFPHNDKKRWVMWTPSGYYDVSAGGEELIGWQINNGKDSTGDYFPVSKFRSTFYRPDVIAKVLETWDETEALKLANRDAGKKEQDVSLQKLFPPIVSIVSPANESDVSSTEVKIVYAIRNPSGEPVTKVKMLIDGRPVPSQRSVKIAKDQSSGEEMTITIPEKDCEVSVIAENQYTASDPAAIKLHWLGKAQAEEYMKPKLYILSVGISEYQDENLRLALPAKDARDFADAMVLQKGNLYRDVIPKVLTNAGATKDSILDGLDWLQRETTSKDVAMVFVAGHGTNDATGNFYILPVDVNVDRLKRTGVSFSEFKNTISALAGKVIVFIDACHSGNIMGERRGTTDINSIVNELTSAENGAVVFSSSTGKQYSLEDPKWNNGAFTKALVEGLTGKADLLGKGKITVNMLDTYIAERVKDLTNGRQTPVTTKPPNVQDFPIAVKK